MCSKEIRGVQLKNMVVQEIKKQPQTQEHPKERAKNSNKMLNNVGLVLLYRNGCNLGIKPLRLVSKVKEESHA